MKSFMAVFLGTGSSEAVKKWETMDKATRAQKEQEAMTAWMQWATTNAAVIVDQGAPLGKTKRIDAKGVSDTRNALTAYVIVRAESHEAAAQMFTNHPHFMIFPGDGVEVMECLPTPTL